MLNHKDDIAVSKYSKREKLEFQEGYDPFKDFLKPEAKIILDDLDNYSLREYYMGSSICGYCNKSITPLFLPLILWNKDQIHYIEFHVECVIKKEKLKDFIDFIEDFDYVYEIED